MEDLASIPARVLANNKRFEMMTATEVRTAEGEIIKIHPSLNIIPLMGKDKMKRLVRSIEKNGLQMPIIVDAMGEKEADAALVGHIGAAGDAALVAQVQQIPAHVFLVQLIGRVAVIGGEPLNALQINFLGRG